VAVDNPSSENEAPAAQPMRVLFATSECEPWVKTGGLADVAGALTAQLRAEGVDVRVVMPAYRSSGAWPDPVAPRVPVAAMAGLPEAALVEARLPGGVPAYLVDCPPLYGREGNPYVDAQGRDWPDNAQRFALLSRVAALLASEASPLDWQPDVLHANDWQTAASAAVVHFDAGRRVRTLVTIHNLAFQGVFDGNLASLLGLPARAFGIDGVEFYGRTSYLKAGLVFADRLSTVSPTYAREIQRAPLGFGLEGVLAKRAGRLVGILNGIDTGRWDPSHDPSIAARYGQQSLDRKARNKAALQQAFGLEIRPDVPLLGMVSRLTTQKGADLVATIAPRIASRAQVAILGSGDRAIESALLNAAALHARAIGVSLGFDDPLAHRIEAGADAFLMPSRFEPCGLNQMYSQRYGTPPIAHATGGLCDTIVDATPEAIAMGRATGFLFDEPTESALEHAIDRALASHARTRTWRKLQRAGMAQAFGWSERARDYVALYRAMLGEPIAA
jgi:starch synthase